MSDDDHENTELIKAYLGATPPPGLLSYWKSLGRFVDVFSLAEYETTRLLWHYSGVKQPISQAIFSGARVDAASGLIKRIADTKPSLKKRRLLLDHILKQLGELTRVRNDLLHYGATRTTKEGERAISNSIAAHIAERWRSTKISPDILDAMSADLMLICMTMYALRSKPSVLTPDLLRPRKGFLAWPPLRPWHYKSERPSSPDRKRRSPLPGHRRPPKPSDG